VSPPWPPIVNYRSIVVPLTCGLATLIDQHLLEIWWPIANLLPMTEQLFIFFHHICFILSDLKCYGKAPQALEIIFEVQRKK